MNVSIALATYNGERWLRDQLRSLANQTLLPCELVVSDDQSTDRTVKLVEEFAVTSRFPVRVIRNGVRLGFSDNFINALRYCTGDVIAYCDQDDVWSTSKLEHCVAPMRRDSTVTVVHHDCEEVSFDLRPLGVILRPKGNRDRMRRRAQHAVMRVFAQGCCMLVHRRVVDAVLRYWPETHLDYVTRSGSRSVLAHDVATLRIASILGTVVYLSDILIHHRRHQQNTWSPDLVPSLSSSVLELAERVALFEDYARLGTITGSMYQEMAERAEANGDSRVARSLAQVAHREVDFALLYAGRVDLYSATSRLSRLARFCKMVSVGAYGGAGGALDGVRSAFKDSIFALAGPRAPQLLEKVRDKLRPELVRRNWSGSKTQSTP